GAAKTALPFCIYAIAALVFGGRVLTKCSMSLYWLPRLVRAALSIKITSSTLSFGPFNGVQLLMMDGFPLTLILTFCWVTLAGVPPGCLAKIVTTARP